MAHLLLNATKKGISIGKSFGAHVSGRRARKKDLTMYTIGKNVFYPRDFSDTKIN